MRRLLVCGAVATMLAAACGGGDTSPAADTATGSPAVVPSSVAPSPTKAVAPAPEEPMLTARDRRYLQRLGKSGRSEFTSEPAAIEAGKELCATIQRADKKKGSVNVELSPSFTELVVEGLRVSFDVYPAALKVYCPKFGFLIQEFPG